MLTSPHNIYKQSSVQTATSEQLVIMLYDGAIRFIKAGIAGIENRRYDEANNNMIRCQAILNELIAALNHDYPISKQLYSIYEYMIYLTIQSNIQKKSAGANEVLGILESLREAWKEAIKKVQSTNHTGLGLG